MNSNFCESIFWEKDDRINFTNSFAFVKALYHPIKLSFNFLIKFQFL